MEIKNGTERLLRAPFSITKNVISYASETAYNTREVFFPRVPSRQLPFELAGDQLEHDIQVAKETYLLGKKKKIHELGFIGGGWLVKLLCKAQADPSAPDEVVESLAEFLVEDQIDPLMEPVVSDEEAIKALKIIENEDPRVCLFILPDPRDGLDLTE